MKKVILIICYFGKLPNYFNLFMRSCAKNNEIDFLFVTDCESQINQNIPRNFHVLPMAFNEIVELIRKKVGAKCICHRPYKLCDYRPTYRLLFSDHIAEYDYWGHCDIDLLFGDLKKFIDKPMEDGYQKIFNYGHLTLYANNEVNNNAYKRKFFVITHEFVFSHKLSFGFDERRGMTLLYKENNIPAFTEDYSLDVIPSIRSGNLKIQFANCHNYSKQFILWNDGKVFLYFMENKKFDFIEYAYVHMQKRRFVDNAIKTDKYVILPDSFEDVTKIDASIFSRFDFSPTVITKRRWLPSLYRFYALWYKTAYKWRNKKT
jgi:hypothetical protein